MDKVSFHNATVRFNFFPGTNRYVLLTGKTGHPSAAFRLYPEKGVVIEDPRNSSAYPAGE